MFNLLVLANDQQNPEKDIENLPKVIDCDKVSVKIKTSCIIVYR